MKLTVELDVDYDGIDKASQEDLQMMLDLIFRSVAVAGIIANVKISGNVVKIHPKSGVLFYYKKTEMSEIFNEPTLSQYNDLKTSGLDLLGSNMDDITYEQFVDICKQSYEESRLKGFGVTVQSKFVEYTDDVQLESIKDTLRNEENFLGFPGDKQIDELLLPLKKFLKKHE